VHQEPTDSITLPPKTTTSLSLLITKFINLPILQFPKVRRETSSLRGLNSRFDDLQKNPRSRRFGSQLSSSAIHWNTCLAGLLQIFGSQAFGPIASSQTSAIKYDLWRTSTRSQRFYFYRRIWR
jgi:hypothetical protein